MNLNSNPNPNPYIRRLKYNLNPILRLNQLQKKRKPLQGSPARYYHEVIHPRPARHPDLELLHLSLGMGSRNLCRTDCLANHILRLQLEGNMVALAIIRTTMLKTLSRQPPMPVLGQNWLCSESRDAIRDMDTIAFHSCCTSSAFFSTSCDCGMYLIPFQAHRRGLPSREA